MFKLPCEVCCLLVAKLEMLVPRLPKEEPTLDGKAGLGLGSVRTSITEVRVIYAALTDIAVKLLKSIILGPGA